VNWKLVFGTLTAAGFACLLWKGRAEATTDLIPDWPMIRARRDGRLYDVRDFIRPEEVEGIADRLWKGDERQFVVDSLNWVHSNIAYEPDTGEYWRFPHETLSRGASDCEDIAILLSSIAENHISSDRFHVVLGTVRDYGHAWNEYYNGDRRWFLDPTSGDMWEAGAGGMYRMMYRFNSEMAEEV